MTALRLAYLLLLLAAAALFGSLLRTGQWLQTDLNALLPQESQWSTVQIQAEQRKTQQLNQQMIALAGTPNLVESGRFLQQLAEQWRATDLFAEIVFQVQPDMQQFRQELDLLKLVTLPESIREQLIHAPQIYFQEYAEQLVTPFEQANLLPLGQDWLGLARFTTARLSPIAQQDRIRWDNTSGLLYVKQEAGRHAEADDKVWGLLRATLKEGNVINPSEKLARLAEEARHSAEEQNVRLLLTGPALFGAAAKQQAERESLIMSLLGIGLTLLLLFACFRTVGVLWLFLPIVTGMLLGTVATLLVFDRIHILTLVIGTSLIGVLLDFPLHWLAASLFNPQWQAAQAMRRLRLTFLISLIVTLLGYGLLGFTTLLVLKQTALFSAVSLIGAMLSTLLLLPCLFRHYKGQNRSVPVYFTRHYPAGLRPFEWGGVAVMAILTIMGIMKSQWQDDIRQWVAMPPTLLTEAKQIADLTGFDLGARAFLLTAESEQALLEKDDYFVKKLQHYSPSESQSNISLKPIVEIQSLSQWLMTETQRQQFLTTLKTTLKPTALEPLKSLGISSEKIFHAIDELKARPPVGLEQALNTTLGQRYKNLYLGRLDKGQYVGLINVKFAPPGDINDAEISALAEPEHGIYWLDNRAHLNRLFQQTRDQAGWLKLLSFVLAGGLLFGYFGLRRTFTMLLIPLGAIICTIGILGWLGIPISLFAMFGLLLVSAIGIDYTAYMQTTTEPVAHKRVAILLAGTTTLISFLLLSISSTPAVAAFGLSVSLGVAVSLVLTWRFLR